MSLLWSHAATSPGGPTVSAACCVDTSMGRGVNRVRVAAGTSEVTGVAESSAEGSPTCLFLGARGPCAAGRHPSNLPPLPSGETLLSPLVMCGPHGLKFLKPVELRLPHCASMTPDGWSFALKSSDSSSGTLSSLCPWALGLSLIGLG